MNERKLECRGKTLVVGARTLIMGILNITPDSFSDGGQHNSLEAAVARARLMVEEGADILDIGGESTRPGAQVVSEEEELRRIIPVIQSVSSQVDVPISVDTYKAEVARQALEAGAAVLNDIWGCKEEPEMAAVAAEYGCPIVLMHNRRELEYRQFMTDVIDDLLESVAIARRAGVREEQIILDPGIGFAKTQEQNLFLLKHLHQIVELGYPVLLGTSRKRTIRHVLNVPVDQALEGTAATVVLGAAQGVSIMRVHDVLAMKRAAKMADAVLQAQL